MDKQPAICHGNSRPGILAMNAQLTIDNDLVEQARQAGQHSTGEEAVRSALEEYVARRQRQRIIDLFGTVEYEDDYDYKAARNRKSS